MAIFQAPSLLIRIVTLQFIYSGTELAFIATTLALLMGVAITRVYLFRHLQLLLTPASPRDDVNVDLEGIEPSS